MATRKRVTTKSKDGKNSFMSTKNKMEFHQLAPEPRKLLLKALNISTNNMKCEYCKKPVNYKTCSILPGIQKDTTTILCGSMLCLSEYITRLEAKKKLNKKIKR